MASSKLISSSSSSRSRNSDLSRRPKPKPSPASADQTLSNNATAAYINPAPMTVDGLYYNAEIPAADLDAQISLMDTVGMEINTAAPPPRPKTVDEVWEEIVSGGTRKECKREVPDEMMTLEDFLARAGAVEEEDVKDFQVAPPPESQGLSGGLSGAMFGFDQMGLSSLPSIEKVEGLVGFGNGAAEVAATASGGRGRGKRSRAVLEPMLDKAAQQRQRRMIKNRESAARSRERKQAYQLELETLVARFEEENEQLLKEEAERTKERLKQLMENVIPVVEKRRPSRVLRRVRSLQW